MLFRSVSQSRYNSYIKEVCKQAGIDTITRGKKAEVIGKGEVRGKLASPSTLWHWEKAGKLQSYGIGGKRYYKREDIENLFQPIK